MAAAVLGSSVAFLDGSVVNAALPAIAKDLHAGLADLQWVLTGYLLTLGSLLVIGGSLGDLFGRRRMFTIGLLAGIAALLVLAFTHQGIRPVWTIIQTCLILGSVLFATGLLGEQIAGQRAELRELRRQLDEVRADQAHDE